MESEFDDHKDSWRIKDFFYDRIVKIDGDEIAFVHIDTNFLAYGWNGEPGNKYMKSYFRKYRWSEERIFV